jgi:hypothetical protein
MIESPGITALDWGRDAAFLFSESESPAFGGGSLNLALASGPPRVTARISGLRRRPLQASQNRGFMKAFKRFLVNSLSLS